MVESSFNDEKIHHKKFKFNYSEPYPRYGKEAPIWFEANTWRRFGSGSAPPYELVCKKQLERRGTLKQFKGHSRKNSKEKNEIENFKKLKTKT